jgi:hypothetical protein
MKDPTNPVAGESEPLRAIALRLLEREGARGETASGVAAGATRAGEKLCAHLGRVVGTLGMSALSSRGLALTRSRFPWLVLDAQANPDQCWPALGACLEAQTAEAAREASLCLVSRVLGLLGGLIGDALVLRLLDEVWPDVVPNRPSEETP